LLEIREHKQEFTSISELSFIETLLATLEPNLQAFKQILPKLDSRRGLLDICGSILKSLFGTAVISYVTSLRDAFDELQLGQKDVIHSMTNQFTYIERLDFIINVKVDAISNLSRIINSNIIFSHQKFQQTTRDIFWLNLTVHGKRTSFATIRQLQFPILRLTQQFNELTSAAQHVIAGKLTMSSINHFTLHNILKNISLYLMECYELITETKLRNIDLYYGVIQTGII
jgi:hypothetical protein